MRAREQRQYGDLTLKDADGDALKLTACDDGTVIAKTVHEGKPDATRVVLSVENQQRAAAYLAAPVLQEETGTRELECDRCGARSKGSGEFWFRHRSPAGRMLCLRCAASEPIDDWDDYEKIATTAAAALPTGGGRWNGFPWPGTGQLRDASDSIRYEYAIRRLREARWAADLGVEAVARREPSPEDLVLAVVWSLRGQRDPADVADVLKRSAKLPAPPASSTGDGERVPRETLGEIGRFAMSHSGADTHDVLLAALYRIGEECEQAAASSSSAEGGGDAEAGLPGEVRSALHSGAMVPQDAEVFDLMSAPNAGLTFFVGGGPDPACDRCGGTGELKVLPATAGAGPQTQSVAACSCRWRSARPLVPAPPPSSVETGEREALERATVLVERYGNAIVRISAVLDNHSLGLGKFTRIRAIIAGLDRTAPPPVETGDGREWVQRAAAARGHFRRVLRFLDEHRALVLPTSFEQSRSVVEMRFENDYVREVEPREVSAPSSTTNGGEDGG